jgi:hypothetical protein
MSWNGQNTYCGGNKKCIQNFGWKLSREETTWEMRHRWDDVINIVLNGNRL